MPLGNLSRLQDAHSPLRPGNICRPRNIFSVTEGIEEDEESDSYEASAENKIKKYELEDKD